jgi:hypothetical protein
MRRAFFQIDKLTTSYTGGDAKYNTSAHRHERVDEG